MSTATFDDSEFDGEGTDHSNLPHPETEHIVLRCTLHHRQVYRLVRFPKNYSVHLLHRFLQYSFGWNDGHLHKFDVFGPVETYSASNPKRRGHVKEWGKSRLEIGMIRDKDGIGELTESFGEPRTSEDKIMLENIWHQDESQNIRHLDNSQIALLYTYDFGGESPIPLFQTLYLTVKIPGMLISFCMLSKQRQRLPTAP